MVKNGKTPKSKSAGSERETRVLLENISRDVKRIAETQSSANTQIAEIKSTIAGLATKSELEIVSMAVMSLGEDVKTLQNNVKRLDTKVDAIDTRLKTVENKIDENLTNHEKRIIKLEEKVLA